MAIDTVSAASVQNATQATVLKKANDIAAQQAEQLIQATTQQQQAIQQQSAAQRVQPGKPGSVINTFA